MSLIRTSIGTVAVLVGIAALLAAVWAGRRDRRRWQQDEAELERRRHQYSLIVEPWLNDRTLGAAQLQRDLVDVRRRQRDDVLHLPLAEVDPSEEAIT